MDDRSEIHELGTVKRLRKRAQVAEERHMVELKETGFFNGSLP